MALDGIAIYSIIKELSDVLIGGRVDKIYQPEKDEIVLSVRGSGNNYKLVISANPSHPRFHFTKAIKDNPTNAPMFCMVLRKHLQSGKITKIIQPNFERIAEFHIESLSEMGDMSTKRLIIEIMGKHSNIILTDENGIILDSIKHVSFDKSSVRQVLPTKLYELPPSQDKKNPLELTKESFIEATKNKNAESLQELIFKTYCGISPIIASEICERAKLSCSLSGEALSNEVIEKTYNSFNELISEIKNYKFYNEIIYDEKGKIVDFTSIQMKIFENYKKVSFESMSELLDTYYASKDLQYRMSQKTSDLKKIIQTNIDRCNKKKSIHDATLKDVAKRDKFKVNGELLTANIYSLEKGMTSFTTQNFYDEELKDITITLDPNLTPSENAQKHFNRYNKQKRTFVALQDQILQNEAELKYLESVLSNLEGLTDAKDIDEIRVELAEEGFVKKKKLKRGEKPQKMQKSSPMHFVSSDGFHIYVGKNNKQNDELTLKFANNNDLWLHTKIIPGSHVIVKTEGQEISETALSEAALLAAFYSKAKESSSVPVDYTLKKNVKKPNGSKPGMVIYETNKTFYVTPSEEEISKIVKL